MDMDALAGGLLDGLVGFLCGMGVTMIYYRCRGYRLVPQRAKKA